MSVGISLEELLTWDKETSDFWKTHLELNPELLDLPCGIGGSANVRDLVRHVWGVQLRWGQRLAGLPLLAKEDMPAGPLEALFAMHRDAVEIFQDLLAAPEASWSEPFYLDIKSIPEDAQKVTRRKVAGHALLHGQRHWAQLATLVRNAGFPSKFGGDLLLSAALP